MQPEITVSELFFRSSHFPWTLAHMYDSYGGSYGSYGDDMSSPSPPRLPPPLAPSLPCASQPVDIWNPEWGTSPSSSCKQWAANSSWGALANDATLQESCETPWATSYCLGTCCELLFPPSPPSLPPSPPSPPTLPSPQLPPFLPGDSTIVQSGSDLRAAALLYAGSGRAVALHVLSSTTILLGGSVISVRGVNMTITGHGEGAAINGTSPCFDTPDWRNDWDVDCSSYASKEGWCANGAVVPGEEWALGATNNYPEDNCCVCGKPPPSSPSSLFDVKADGSLELHSITLANGRTPLQSAAGGIVSFGNLSLWNVTVLSCAASQPGEVAGALFIGGGSATLSAGCSIIGCSAEASSGSQAAGGILLQGGFLSMSDVTISSCIGRANSGYGTYDAAAALLLHPGTLTYMVGVTITGCAGTSSQMSGGIVVRNAQLTMTGCAIEDCHCTAGSTHAAGAVCSTDGSMTTMNGCVISVSLQIEPYTSYAAHEAYHHLFSADGCSSTADSEYAAGGIFLVTPGDKLIISHSTVVDCTAALSNWGYNVAPVRRCGCIV